MSDINFDPNGLFYKMLETYKDNKDNLYWSEEYQKNIKKKVIFCNEGGSRSSKTWDAFYFIWYICNQSAGSDLDIYILRKVLKKNKDYTLKDFKKVLKTIGVYDENCLKGENTSPYYNLYGNNIYFRGLDDESDTEGYPSDIVFINETLEISQRSFVAGILMRCRMLVIQDWNPKFTAHWAFDQEGQDNVHFTHTTYKNNKHLEDSVAAEIESYAPWKPNTYEVKNQEVYYKGRLVDQTHQPPQHPYNVKKGTADEFRWRVYGLGIRGSQEGKIFKNVSYIEEFPKDIGYSYGLDFGFTNDPTVLTRCAEDETDIYVEYLCYSPMDSPDLISDYMDAMGIERDVPITADSSDRYTKEGGGTVRMVGDLQEMGWEISKVSKTKSISYWLGTMKRKRINIVCNQFEKQARDEFNNYMWRTIEGIPINQPIDKWNHGIDSARYRHMSFNLDTEITSTLRR